ncbi:unnamed protein product [Ilex paraguariensis]|uniref:Uncharacterized protein n=1 Tax=Ilex paraguariensis TaxID=185542 RepID=A0ABC8RXW1_9AQUA
MVVSKSAPDQDFAITNLEVVIGNQKNNILHENNSQLLSNVIAIAPNAVSQAPSSSHVVQGENSKIENQNMPASQRQDTSALALSNTTDKTTAFPRNNGMGKPSLDPNRPNSCHKAAKEGNWKGKEVVSFHQVVDQNPINPHAASNLLSSSSQSIPTSDTHVNDTNSVEATPVDTQILQTKQQVSCPEVGKEVPEVMPVESPNRFAELNKEEDSHPNNCSPSTSQEEQVSTSFSDKV